MECRAPKAGRRGLRGKRRRAGVAHEGTLGGVVNERRPEYAAAAAAAANHYDIWHLRVFVPLR